ncbi:MAG: sulfotransferase [Actinomycetota bacterium]|nr:sulfotransferase [Actinomycetota bacterium]
MTPRFKRAWRRALRKGASLRSRARRSPGGVRPENIVWIFGTGRSGSTWLGSMMGGLDGCAMWNEPLVGNLFGNFHYFRVGGRKPGRQYILGEPYKETWLGPMRDLVLGGAAARFPELMEGGYLIIKEPNGSIGSPLLMEALPESRMIFLIRDPRDVVASSMDARSEGSWLQERREARRRTSKPDRNPNVYVRMRANSYVQQIEKTGQAYRAHGGHKVMVRYEDLRADTLETMKRIYTALEIPVEEAELARSVEKNSWENIPEQEKGEGKKRRKAKPGGWREDLTARQVEIVEDITAPLLNEFYPHTATTRGAL